VALRPDGALRRTGIALLVAAGLGLSGAAGAVHESPRPAAAVARATAAPAANPAANPAAPAPPSGIGPGAVTETPGAGICTAGFLFRGGGRTFLGQAAHCAGTGPDTETDGCTSSTLRPGAPVIVRGARGPVGGVLAYSSWTAMQDGGETDRDTCAANDFALVALPAGATVASTLPVLGGPTGIRATAPVPGATVHGLAVPERPVDRPGTIAPGRGDGDDGGWLHTVRTAIPGTPGESGGPLVDDRGAALGILSGMEAGGGRRLEYTDLARAAAYARTHGAPADLELVPGTAPFAPG
jgi:hypothetical protein